MARPKKTIDLDLLEKLAALHCTMQEIASICKCSKDTIERNYLHIVERGRNQSKAKLRRLQWQSAESGNVVMQIFLGKNILEQSDKHETKHEGEIGFKLVVEDYTHGK